MTESSLCLILSAKKQLLEAALDPLDLLDRSSKKVTVTRFSVCQKSILNTFFRNGMTWEPKEHDPLARAAMDSQLTTCQVKV